MVELVSYLYSKRIGSHRESCGWLAGMGIVNFMTLRKRKVRVERCKIGKGVFAQKFIEAGEDVGRVRGEIFDDPNYGSNYCIDLGDNFSLEPKAPFRYLNHNCTPNCQLVVHDDSPSGRERYAMVEALRDIKPGEELTIDYGWAADAAIPCLCRSSACRGWVVAAEELHLVEKQAIAR